MMLLQQHLVAGIVGLTFPFGLYALTGYAIYVHIQYAVFSGFQKAYYGCCQRVF
ncbi:hypothetical protein D3C87_2184690 [compost metagenome]